MVKKDRFSRRQTKAIFKVGDRVLHEGTEFVIEEVRWNGFAWMCKLKDHPSNLSCGESYLRAVGS